MYIRPDRTYSKITEYALNIEGQKREDKAKKWLVMAGKPSREGQDESSAEKNGYKRVNDLKEGGQRELQVELDVINQATMKIHFYIYIT